MKLFCLSFLLGINLIIANTNPVDIISIAKQQSNISENILENYLLQESIDVSEQIVKDTALFEQNLNLLFEYSKTKNNTLKKLIQDKKRTWLEFKKISQTTFDETNIDKIIELSSNLLLLSEQFSILSQKVYFENLESETNVSSI